jgi:endonuclease YncB( thermonuclease family)
MARRPSKFSWQVKLLLLLAVLAFTAEQRCLGPAPKEKPAARKATTGYELISGCRWQDHKGNDGDSFHVRLPDGRVEQFRLYFVDAPESQFRTYAGGRTNHDRIRDQAQDLGLTDEQAVEIGKRAKTRSRDLLAGKPFTLQTRWDDPFGDRRYHAFVAPDGGPFLEETLVREGLVRIHTKPADLPDGTPAKERVKQLRELEKQAKQAKRGAWGL